MEVFDDEAWEEVLSLNLSAAFRVTKAVLPGMRERGFGRTEHSSVHGLVGSVQKSAYVAAKHLLGLTKVVALETANDGITCNAICPGWVVTDLVERQLESRAEADGRTLAEASADLLRAKQPMPEFSSAESIGALTLFLCGPHGRTITGAAYTMTSTRGSDIAVEGHSPARIPPETPGQFLRAPALQAGPGLRYDWVETGARPNESFGGLGAVEGPMRVSFAGAGELVGSAPDPYPSGPGTGLAWSARLRTAAGRLFAVWAGKSSRSMQWASLRESKGERK